MQGREGGVRPGQGRAERQQQRLAAACGDGSRRMPAAHAAGDVAQAHAPTSATNVLTVVREPQKPAWVAVVIRLPQ